MRNLFYTILVLLTVYACAGKREIVTEQKQVLPAVEDVVMYEINPRVFALKNAFNVISKHLDSIQFLGVNVVWFMPIYEIGEVNDGEGEPHHHHHHLICKTCGKVFPFRDDLLDGLERHIEEETGFHVLDHELKFYGQCKKCRKK